MWTVEDWYNEARAYAEQDAANIRTNADLGVQTLTHFGPDLTESEHVERLKRLHRERLDAVPDLSRYPELRGVRDLVEARWRGWCDGAGLNETQLAVRCTCRLYVDRCLLRLGLPGCSCVYFPRSDHGPIFASNLDSSPAEAFGPPVWRAGKHFMSGGVSAGIYMDELSPEIFPAPVHDLVEHHCTNTEEAVEIYTRYNYFWGGCNFVIVDRNHTLAMIEKSSCRIGVRYSPDGFGFVTAMTAEEPGMKAYLADRRAASVKARKLPPGNPDEAYWPKQDQRRELMNELLNEAREDPTLERMQRIMFFRSADRGNVCGDGDRYVPGGPEAEYTIRTAIWALREKRALWWAREGSIPVWENRKEDVVFSDVQPWE